MLATQPCAAAAAGYIEERLDLQLDSGRVVRARVLRPADASSPAKLPAIMLFGGFETGAAALDLVQPTQATLLASFDYPLEMPGRGAGLVGILKRLPAARRGIHDSLEAMGLLYRQLAARADVDPGRISIIGVSLGAPFAVVAAADHGVPGLGLIHGFADVPQVIAHRLIERWAPERSTWAQAPIRALAWALCGYAGVPDIAAAAARLQAHQRAWMLSAADDDLIPASATASLHRGLAASDASVEFETEPGGHLRGEDDPRIPQLLARGEAWLERAGLR